MKQNAAVTLTLALFLISLCLTQLVTSTSNHTNLKTKIEKDVEVAIRDFSRNCSEIVRKHVRGEQLRHKRTGFLNFPALRQNPEGVRVCSMSLIGDIELADYEKQAEKICNAIRTCAQHLDPSSSHRTTAMVSFYVPLCVTIASVLFTLIT